MKKAIAKILSAALLLSALSTLSLWTAAAPDAEYVTAGLVSLYRGDESGDDPTVWKDAWGKNDLTGLGNDEENHFTEEGYRLSGTQFPLPAPLWEALRGEEYTLEVQLGDVAVLDPSTNVYIPLLCNLEKEYFSLYVHTKKGEKDSLIVKTSGLASEARPTVDEGGLELVRNSTVSVTFQAGGRVCVYVDGVPVAVADAPSANQNRNADAGALILGNSEKNRRYTALFCGLRFYDRALTEEEIRTNALADGASVPDTPVSPLPQPKEFVQVAQPDTGIVGDVAFSEYVTKKQRLEQLIASDCVPANLIFYVNDRLQAVDADSENPFLTVEEVFAALDGRVIPTFYVKDETAVDALCTYLKENLWEDLFVMSSDPALVKRARQTCPMIRGIVDFSRKYTSPMTEQELVDVRKTVNSNLCKVVVLPWGPASAADVDWLNDRAMTVWIDVGQVSDTPAALSALLSGAYGIVSSSTEFLWDACRENIPRGTVTRPAVNVAHRGLFESTPYPENTLEAMIAAYQAGAEMIELDIYLTTDRQLAVNHNAKTGAVYDRALTIEECTMEQLKQLNAVKNGKSYKMPTLREVFEEFRDKDVRFMIEIKSQNPEIVPVLKSLIDEYDNYARCTVITFEKTGLLETLAEQYPEMPVGLLTKTAADDATVRSVQQAVSRYNNTYSPTYSEYDDDYVKAALKRGITTWVWTINDPSAMAEYLKYGHSGITGNRSDLMGAMVKRLTTSLTDGAEIPVGEAFSVPLAAVTYNGTEKTVSSNVTLKVLSGDASIDGGTVTVHAPGQEVVLAAFYTVPGTDGYTVALAPLTLKTASPSASEASPSGGVWILVCAAAAALLLAAVGIAVAVCLKRRRNRA